MWPFGKKNISQRRLEIRRSAPVAPSWFVRTFRKPGAAGSFAIALMFFILATAMGIWPADPLGYQQGQYVASDITAREDFRVLSVPLLEETARLARSSTPATFRLNQSALEEIIAGLEKMPAKLQAAKTIDKVPPQLLKTLSLEAPKPDAKPDVKADKKPDATPDKKKPAKPKPQPKQKTPPTKSQQAYAAWVALAGPDARAGLAKALGKLREELTRYYIVRADQTAQQQGRTSRHVVLVGASGESHVQKVVNLIGQDETQRLGDLAREASANFGSAIRPGVESYLLARLSGQPMYLYDATKTESDKKISVQSVLKNPPDGCYKHYQRGQILARSSNRPTLAKDESLGLSEAELELLRAEHANHLLVEGQGHPLRKWLRLSFRGLLVLLLTSLLCTYIVCYAPHIIEDNIRGLKLASMLLVMLAIVRGMELLPGINPHASVMAVCIAGIILTVSYDQRFALAVGSVLAAMVVLQIRGDLALLAVLLAGLMSMVFQVREIRNRSKLLVVSLITAAVVFVMNLAMATQAGVLWRFSLGECLWSAAGALLAGLLVQGLLPAIEHIFGVATGSTLLEWCDASKPLLKRLAMESPGTYNHSLQLGAMCGAAAETIGARGLLARVGAYYHDVGKINKPEYFTENQAGENKHEKLNPAMSVLIILGHVKDGLELARKYNLPVALREFIGTHHGTTLVQYFYHTATQQSETDKAPAPDESQFRYPGPKPHSKEAAILMLADAAESSVRAMSEPTPTRIATQVHAVVTARLEDGQFDDCELTLREVHQIEDSLVKSLCGVYHGRIAYPSPEKENANKKQNGEAGRCETT